jgi:hypothetical protein
MILDPEDEAFNEIERQAQQRKEAVRAAMRKDIDDDTQGYLSDRPKREWVGLTDEDQFNLVHAMNENDWDAVQVMEAIEAKLKEKNT